eukprot:1968933-Amphidinium_carterae.1
MAPGQFKSYDDKKVLLPVTAFFACSPVLDAKESNQQVSEPMRANYQQAFFLEFDFLWENSFGT